MATGSADEVVPVFVLDDTLLDAAGPFRRAQLLGEVAALDATIREHTGGRLFLRRADPAQVLADLVDDRTVGVFWNDDVAPYATARDARVEAALSCPVQRFWGTLFHRPGSVLTGKGTLSKVFTPFYNRWIVTDVDPWPTPGSASVATGPGESLDALVQAAGPAPLPPGEAGAADRLADWARRADNYLTDRDTPSIEGTSMLSSDLKFGTLSPRHIAQYLGTTTSGREGFVRQLSWRDWWAHTLYEFPALTTASVRPEYDNIAWRYDEADFSAWATGQTGYPIVDAGMRQLAQTGWMHNRVRMITASFLVKDLLIDWRHGERHFRKLLIDADLAQNGGNWQWVAGTGPDAAPYFRIFNPTSQSRKFDPHGAYIRTWVPELSALDSKAIHEPAAAAPLDLAGAGVILGDTYPAPIVDHAFARERTLAAYKAVKES